MNRIALELASGRCFSPGEAVSPSRVGWRRFVTAPNLLLTAYLLLTFVGTSPFSYVPPAERQQGSLADRLLVISMLVAAFGLILSRRKAAVACLRANKLMFLLVAFCLLSAFWSDYPDLTFRRGLAFVFTLAITLGIAASIANLRECHTILFAVTTAVILFNLLGVALWPGQAIAPDGVQGLYSQKNQAGMVAMIAVIIAATWTMGAECRASVLKGLAATGVALAFLVVTRSKTSMGLTAVALAFCGLFLLAQRIGPRFVLLASAALALLLAGGVGLFILSDFDLGRMLGLFLTDTTFTGRDDLWSFAWRTSLERPWLGHGYGAFWDVGEINDPLSKMEPGTWLGDVDKGGLINEAHNGYLELMLVIGVPAMILAVAVIVIGLCNAIQRLLAAPARGDKALFLMIALMLFAHLWHNVTESTLFMRSSPFFMLILLLLLTVNDRSDRAAAIEN
jgi:O-antigen ligase